MFLGFCYVNSYVNVLDLLYLLCPFLTDTVQWDLIRICAYRAFLTHCVLQMITWKNDSEKQIEHVAETKLIIRYIQCWKRGLRASDRCVVPLDWTSCPGLQVVCGTQVIHSSEEQWNPCLHMQMVRLSLLWSGTRKFLSERIVDKSRTLCHIKQKSINTGTVLFDLSQGLTLATEWLTLTDGFFCVFFLILILVTDLALRFHTSAERCHAGPWKTQCCFTIKHAVLRIITVFVSSACSKWGHVT